MPVSMDRTQRGEQPGGSAVVHVLKRLIMALFGYFVALIFGLAGIVALYSILSYIPGTPNYFDYMQLTPIAMLLLPPLWIFTLIVSLMTTFVPAMLVILASESLALRSAWLHMLFGALVGMIGYVLLGERTIGASTLVDLSDLTIIGGAGLIAGFVYWLIAGRDAGFSRSG
jgi:hypothetical protein